MGLTFARQAIDGEGGEKSLLMNWDWSSSSQTEGLQRRDTSRNTNPPLLLRLIGLR